MATDAGVPAARRKLVLCLDGTGQQIGSQSQPTNPAAVFQMLDLTDPSAQIAYYDPGVGTLPSSTARGKVERFASRLMQLGFGWGMRTNLAQAYTWLMQRYQPGDQIYVFGFSRGAYTARALVGMLARPGLMRPGSENLVDYALREYATNIKVGEESSARKKGIEAFADSFCWGTQQNPLFPEGWIDPAHHEDWHCVPVEYVGIWDTVKAAGVLGLGSMKWPYTHQLFNAERIRHAVSIDERRRPYHEYLVQPRDGVEEVWFAGVHSDIGGTFSDSSELSSIALKWVVTPVIGDLRVRDGAYAARCRVDEDFFAGTLHRMGWAWNLVGRRRRVMPPDAAVHRSVELRLADPSLRYKAKLSSQCHFVDAGWPADEPPVPKQDLLTHTALSS